MNVQGVVLMIIVFMFLGASGCKSSKKFIASKHKAGFHDAFITCHQYGFKPAEILTEEEHKTVENLLKNEKGIGTGYGFWTSATNLDSKQTYYWLNSGRKLFYTNFSSGQPDNYKNNENCLHIFQISLGHFAWNDMPCNSHQRFLCQYNEEPCSTYEENKVSVL
ncbi:salivary C-type lectin 2-like [Rhynchophorus ferrugineus]|uniref:salivary C-type lectin 2-like n=1 Tax=Rhynchophorus ferrugineus TaxID=354439 RepID=UPI003FCD7796